MKKLTLVCLLFVTSAAADTDPRLNPYFQEFERLNNIRMSELQGDCLAATGDTAFCMCIAYELPLEMQSYIDYVTLIIADRKMVSARLKTPDQRTMYSNVLMARDSCVEEHHPIGKK